MNEREELQRAREELKSSIKVVQKNLKIFGKAVVSSQKAVLRNVGNNIINTYKQLQSDIYIHKLNKEIARYQKEREAAIKRAEALEEANRRARNRENTRALEAEARRVKAQEREERELKFKRSVKQNTNSLKSRIMVAAGGSGTGRYCGQVIKGGSSGGLIGSDGTYYSCGSQKNFIPKGGTQTSGGFATSITSKCDGQFGYANKMCDVTYGTGGGSGYYGGASGFSSPNVVMSGAGGSSFISGHDGCDAIKEESTEVNIIHTDQSIHYSGLYFTNTLMIDGNGYKWTTEKKEYTGMPSYSDNSTITGNTGNGYARITLVNSN